MIKTKKPRCRNLRIIGPHLKARLSDFSDLPYMQSRFFCCVADLPMA